MLNLRYIHSLSKENYHKNGFDVAFTVIDSEIAIVMRRGERLQSKLSVTFVFLGILNGIWM